MEKKLKKTKSITNKKSPDKGRKVPSTRKVKMTRDKAPLKETTAPNSKKLIASGKEKQKVQAKKGETTVDDKDPKGSMPKAKQSQGKVNSKKTVAKNSVAKRQNAKSAKTTTAKKKDEKKSDKNPKVVETSRGKSAGKKTASNRKPKKNLRKAKPSKVKGNGPKSAVPVQVTSAEDLSISTVKIAHFDSLVDLALDKKDDVGFLVKDRSILKIEYVLPVGDTYMTPPSKDGITWMLSKAASVQKHYKTDRDASLFNALVSYFKKVSELPDQNHYKFLAAYVMHTYLMEKFEYSPIIWLYSIPERGKTRTGKAITYTSFRGVHLITLSTPYIIRLAQNSKATIFFDVSDLQKQMMKNSVYDIMLNRFEKGAKVSRVFHPLKGAFADTTHFAVFGPTVAATNEPINDILSTRAIQIIMPESGRSFPDDVKHADGLVFRERLLAFRARWLDKDLPDVEKPCSGRLGDILKPLRQIVNMVCADEKWFMDFARDVETQRKASNNDSLDAQVISAIIDSRKALTKGHMMHEDILGSLNRNKSDSEKISSQKLGKITTRLGFEKYSSGTQRGIFYNRDLIAKLCTRFGINDTVAA